MDSIELTLLHPFEVRNEVWARRVRVKGRVSVWVRYGYGYGYGKDYS
jgi:hypothetical protein